jgi:hypothetical protein
MIYRYIHYITYSLRFHAGLSDQNKKTIENIEKEVLQNFRGGKI